jgi:hypothetical protein
MRGFFVVALGGGAGGWLLLRCEGPPSSEINATVRDRRYKEGPRLERLVSM